MSMSVLMTCEHGGNAVPQRFARLRAGRSRLLHSHRGWDPGSLELARELSRRLDAPLVACTITRLLIDLNRSEDNPQIWSVISSCLDESEKRWLLRKVYEPYREEIQARLVAATRAPHARAVHVSVHSFTPVLRGVRREVDVGVLFDPSREFEAALARAMVRELRRELPSLRVRANQPYKGTDDGFTTVLRRRLNARRYAGIELEVSQRFSRRGGARWISLCQHIGLAIERALPT